MKITGEITINVISNQDKKTYRYKNVVTKTAIEKLYSKNKVFTDNLRVALSSTAYQENYNLTVLEETLAIGSAIPQVDVYVFNEKTPTEPRYVEYRCRFEPPTSARAIRTVSLIDPVSVTNNYNLYAFRSLPQILTQTPSQTIDIYYRIRLDWGSHLNNLALNSLKESLELLALGQLSNVPKYDLVSYSPVSKNVTHTDATTSDSVISWNNPNDTVNSPLIVESNQDLLKLTYKGTVPNSSSSANFNSSVELNPYIDSIKGRVLASLGYGKESFKTRPYFLSNVTNPKQPFQNVFSHSADATGLFYDANNLANSLIKPIVSGSWNKTLPKLLWLSITSNGTFDTARYKFRYTPYTEVYSGFKPNLIQLPWKAVAEDNLIHYKSAIPPLNDGEARKQKLYEFANFVLPLGSDEILTANQKGFSILNLGTGNYINYNSVTIPSFTCENITQIALNSTWRSDYIYIADRVSGLFRFNRTNNTITKLLNGRCYGVSIRDNGTIVTVLNEQIRYSPNEFSNTTTLSLSGLTNADWQQVNFLHVEPAGSLIKGVLGAKEQYGLNTGYKTKDKIYWWNTANGLIHTSETDNTEIEVLSETDTSYEELIAGGYAASHPSAIYYNQAKDVWVYRYSRYLVNSETNYSYEDRYAVARMTATGMSFLNICPAITGIESNSKKIYTGSSSFNWAPLVINENKELILPKGIYNVNLNNNGLDLVYSRGQETTFACQYALAENNNSGLAYLGNGLVFSDWALYYIYDYNHEPSLPIGVSYGWNTNNQSWGNNSTNSRALHTAPIPLVDGLRIMWSNLASNSNPARPIFAGSFYTQVIAYGVVPDDYEGSISVDYSFSLRAIQTTTVNLTLPTNGQLYLPGAPNSARPDLMWYSLDPDDIKLYDLKINNVQVANVIPAESSLNPAPGQIKILNAKEGLIAFNLSDARRSFSGTFNYYKKIDPTEV